MADVKSDNPFFDPIVYADQIKLHASGKDKPQKKKTLLNIDGETGTFDTGAYGVTRKSSAVSKPSGMPKGKIFKNNDDFRI